MRSAETQKNYTQRRRQLQRQNRILTPKKRRKNNFEALFKRTFKRKITSAKNDKICWQITFPALMQPLQYYLRDAAATFMQSSECVLQHHVANPHLSTHMATEHGNNIMQPFHCDPQPKIQDTQRITYTGTTTRFRTQRRNQFAHETTAAAPAAHTRYLSSPAAATTEKRKVSCSSFPPKTSPMQHSCRHYNAFRSIAWLTRISLRTWQQSMTTIMQPFHCDPQPEIQETQRTTHTGTTTRCRTQEEEPIRAWNDRSRTRRTQEVPFIAGCSHFTRKNTRFRAPASSTKPAPCNIHAAITMRFAASRG